MRVPPAWFEGMSHSTVIRLTTLGLVCLNPATDESSTNPGSWANQPQGGLSAGRMGCRRHQGWARRHSRDSPVSPQPPWRPLVAATWILSLLSLWTGLLGSALLSQASWGGKGLEG